MRLLQLWARLFVASILLYAGALLAVAGGAPGWLGAATMWVVLSLGGAGWLIVAATVLRITALKRRLARAVAARAHARIVEPGDVLEQAFGPLVETRVVRDLTVALILPGREAVFYPGDDAHARQSKLYEVGSLTKPMTAEVLATMIADGMATMATRIGDVLPRLSLPEDIAGITLEELVTHRSGLPRIPRTIKMTLAALFSADPYRSFSDADLLRSLARAHRTTPAGTYSNFGFAVLGRLLGELDGSDYAGAIQTRLLRRLGLDNTHLGLDDALTSRHARGHDIVGVPTPCWHAGAFAGAGGIRMTLADGAAWLAAHLDPREGFSDVVAMVTRQLAPMGPDRIGMAWCIKELDGSGVAWHNGGTGGFSSFAAFDQARGVGVIAFAGSFHINALDVAGFQVVRESAARWGVAADHAPADVSVR